MYFEETSAYLDENSKTRIIEGLFFTSFRTIKKCLLIQPF